MMRIFKLKPLIMAISLSVMPMSKVFANQDVVDSMSEQLQVNYSVLDNRAGENGVDCSSLGADWGACSKILITLENLGDAIKSKEWEIYFHSIRQVVDVGNPQFKVTHITGDLHRLEPTTDFTEFAANSRIEIPLIFEYWQIFQTDILPRWYVASDGTNPKVIRNTDTENLALFSTPLGEDQWMRIAADKNILMTPNSRFTANADMVLLDTVALRGRVIPTPLEVQIQQENVDLTQGIHLELDGLQADSVKVLLNRFALFGIQNSEQGYRIKGSIKPELFKNEKAVSGAYELNMTKTGVEITGFNETGLFYAIQSILSLVTDGQKEIAMLNIKDAPRFGYRGVFLDVGRNFHSKTAVLRLLDQMAAYKLNKFHFHLSDDEGWRIEIPGLPELTEIGSKRCHDLSETRCLLPQLGSGPNSDNMGSGFFTKAEYIEIVMYAKVRHIEVIPEIDVPAHARAAVVSMEARYKRLMAEGKEKDAEKFRLLDPDDTSRTTSVQFYNRQSYLNPCLPSSQTFLDKVIGEIAEMHKIAGQPLKTWHFGGDEAKNIRLGAGYQDRNTAEKVTWRGTIDMSIEDKPWARSPICKNRIQEGKVEDVEHLSSYFALEVSKLVKKHGINRMQAWQDGLKDAKNAREFATDEVAVNFWDTLYWGGFETGNEWANKGYQVVVSNPDYLYMDMPYEVNPAERGYYWATRFSSERKIFNFAPDNLPQNAETSVDRDGNFFTAKGEKAWPGAHGLSAQSWSEVVRTDSQMEYMIFPRVLSVAERAWHRASWELNYEQGREFKGGETQFVDKNLQQQDWNLFANLVGQRELVKIERSGIEYRIPVPGAQIREGRLETNVSLPGIATQYSTDEGESWLDYDSNAKPKVAGSVLVRSISHDSKRVSRAEQLR